MKLFGWVWLAFAFYLNIFSLSEVAFWAALVSANIYFAASAIMKERR